MLGTCCKYAGSVAWLRALPPALTSLEFVANPDAVSVALQGLLVSGINNHVAAKQCVFRGNGKSGMLARMCGKFSAQHCSSFCNTGPAFAVQGSISAADIIACEGAALSSASADLLSMPRKVAHQPL